MIEKVLSLLKRHEERVAESINFTPSENRLSPLARLPLVGDMNARYFLDDLRLFGAWAFNGGKDAGEIEIAILRPLLKALARAEYVNTRPISGLNCMTTALVATTRPGDLVLALHPDHGGHASTREVAENLGRRFGTLPMLSAHSPDTESLARQLERERPNLVYIDQATMLFPLDLRPFREAIDASCPEALLHYDSSHLNGLIFGKVVRNPLEAGADLFGGSTHKTLPGPHKGFLATNSQEIAQRIQAVTDHFISHHQSGAIASLAITLIEFNQCGGEEYARRVVENARHFAVTLDRAGVSVEAAERGFTACHQVWVVPPDDTDMAQLGLEFERCGLIINNFNGLPGTRGPAIRASLAEATRMGAHLDHAEALAEAFADLILRRRTVGEIAERTAPVRAALAHPRYCFHRSELADRGLIRQVDALWRAAGAPTIQ